MKYGLHNALTCYPLKGWQKCFKWFIQPFSCCQNKVGFTESLYDIQVALYNGEWYGSHGIAWYDIKLFDFLDKLDKTNRVVYLRLGYDNHIFKKKDLEEFYKIMPKIFVHYPGVILYEYYVETNKGLEVTKLNDISVFEKHWTLSWAKQKVKEHWYNFPLLLPLPRLWHHFYKKQWLEEFKNSSKEIFMTDFV